MDPCTLIHLLPAPGSASVAEYGDKLFLKQGIETREKPKEKKKSVHLKAGSWF